MKQILNKIVDCLNAIIDNPNVYSRELMSDVVELAEMVNELEETNNGENK